MKYQLSPEAERLTIQQCLDCHWSGFPERLLCPRCHRRSFQMVTAEEGIVEELTAVLYRTGSAEQDPVQIATVRTDVGPRLIARLDVSARRGDRVRLARDGGAVVSATLDRPSPESH